MLAMIPQKPSAPLIYRLFLPFVWEIVLLGKGGKGADFFVCIHFHNDLG
jgi:hypothetical protein